MPPAVKTTVYLDAEDYRRLQRIAEQRAVPAAALVREAVSEFTRAHELTTRPASFGSVDLAPGDLSERVDEHLSGFGDDCSSD